MTLNKAEWNYSVTKREALAVVWALRHYKYLVATWVPDNYNNGPQAIACYFPQRAARRPDVQLDGSYSRIHSTHQAYSRSSKYSSQLIKS